MFWAQSNPMDVRVVPPARTDGPDVTAGTWAYTYNRDADYAGDEHTIVTRPDGSKEVYTYFGVGNGPYNPFGLAWKMGALLRRRIRDAQDNDMETQTYDWQPSEPISNEILGRHRGSASMRVSSFRGCTP